MHGLDPPNNTPLVQHVSYKALREGRTEWIVAYSPVQSPMDSRHRSCAVGYSASRVEEESHAKGGEHPPDRRGTLEHTAHTYIRLLVDERPDKTPYILPSRKI